MAIATLATQDRLVERLAAIAGADSVIRDPDELFHFSLDLSEQPGEIPVLAIRPKTTEQVADIVKTVVDEGYCIVARGAGLSYTRSHVPVRGRTVVIDNRGLNRILEVNLRDRYLTVETGVTWFQIREALAGTGFRVPYQGTYSGRISTIGGALSQNGTGMGRGTLADHVLGLEVVLGDGSRITTGSAITSGTTPFYRYNGPDYTGLFLCDSGAFGIKTKVTLLLEPEPQTAFGVFAFNSYVELVAAQAAIIEAGHSIESFGWGANFLRGLADAPVPPFSEQVALARQYLARSPDKIRALRALWRAWSPRGLGYLRDLYSAMYVMSEAYSQAEADRIMADITRIARKMGAKVLPTTIGFGTRHGPYPDVRTMLVTPRNEIWFPVNGKFPVSKIVEATKAIDTFTAANAEIMKRHEIRLECNFLSHGYFCGVEPIFFWKRNSPYRDRFRTGENVKLDIPPIDEATLAVFELRRGLAKALRDLGALHLQWGKAYPYRDSLGADEWRFVERLKQAVDPKLAINPGSLGLGEERS